MKKQLILLLMLFTTISGVFSQAVSLTGTVKDKTGDPLPGVTIVIKGQATGTITDMDGNFNLQANQADVLVISFVGMQTQEITVGSSTTFNIVLNDDMVGLGEVVAVGYGTRKKESLTSAISNIKADEIVTTTHSSLAQALQGKVSGLQIRQNTGEPGSFDTGINTVSYTHLTLPTTPYV
jgi:hypothetical protein